MTSLVGGSFSSPSYTSEPTLGHLLDFLLGDPAPLSTLLAFDDDGDLDDGTVIVILFPSDGSSLSRSQDTPSPEPGGSGEDTCIEVFNGGGLFDKKSSQDASFGSSHVTQKSENENRQMVMKERKRTGFWSSILYGSRPAMLPRISFQKRSEEIHRCCDGCCCCCCCCARA